MKKLTVIAILLLLTLPPAHAQGKLKATASLHSITLTWNPSPTTGATYNLYRGPTAAGPFTETIGATTPFIDTNVTAGTTYIYQVTAACGATACGPNITANSESVPSNQISATVPNPQPPQPPTGLSGTVAVIRVGTQDRITATWSDAPGVSTMYALFNTTQNYVQENGAPTPTAAGNYSATYTGTPFNGNFAICDAHNACLILPFIG